MPLIFARYDADSDRVLLQTQIQKQEQDVGELVLIDVESGSVLKTQELDAVVLPWRDMISAMGGSEYAMPARQGETRAFVGIFNLRGEAEPLMRVGFEPEAQKSLKTSCDMTDVTYDMDEHGNARMIHGVLFMPHNLPTVESQRAALIYAHGGPTANTAKAWSADIQFLTSLGYIVFGPNPRGSYGHGKKFESMNDADWGGGDFRDYCYGLTYLIRNHQLDPRRVGIFGGSYGGYMTNWAITRPNTPLRIRHQPVRNFQSVSDGERKRHRRDDSDGDGRPGRKLRPLQRTITILLGEARCGAPPPDPWLTRQAHGHKAKQSVLRGARPTRKQESQIR